MSEEQSLAAYGVSQRGLLNAAPKPMDDWQWEEIRIQEELRRKEYQKEIEQKERRELRDRFAMAALTGLLTDFDFEATIKVGQEFAEAAYVFADAMLKARGDE